MASNAALFAVVALMALGLVGGAVCFVQMAGAESLTARAADGALLLLDLVVLTALSVLIWPRRA